MLTRLSEQFPGVTRTKLYIYSVVGGIAAVLVLALLFVGGSAAVKFALKERPSFHTGTVIEKDYDKPWTEFTTQQVYTGESCTQIGEYRSCTSNYITVPQVIHHPADWDIRIKNCDVRKKDGTYWLDKEGRHKCFTKWVDVDETGYNRVGIGQEWRG